MKGNIIKRMKKNYVGYIMIAPLFIGLLIFAYYPPVYGIGVSLFEKQGENVVFCGLKNYSKLFSDKIFLNSIPTMFYLMIPKLLIGVFVPLIAAEMVFGVKSCKMQGFYRILLLLPMLAPGVVGTLIWKAVYDPNGGIMSTVVQGLGFVGKNKVIDWLGDPDLVIFSIIFMGFPWIGGTNVLIYLAGLNVVSGEIMESARLDGAGAFKRIWFIDLPLLLGQIRYFLVFGIIGGLQDYSVQVVLTNGGPGYSTYVPGYYMYHQAFMFFNKYYAAAIGCVLFVVIMVLTLVVSKLTGKDKTET